MSRAIVGEVIDTLLTDEGLRMRFALNRVETVVALCLRGFDLDRDEIELFCQTDPDLWFMDNPVARERRH